MCDYKVKRILQENGGPLEEWRKLDGSWTTDPKEAVPISEEDARAHVKQLQQKEGIPGSYKYESVLL